MSGYYPTAMGIYNSVTRLLNVFIDALNTNNLLSKFILVILDKDLLIGHSNRTGISVIIGAILHHVIEQMDLLIERRKMDLLQKCPGGVIDDEFPKIIWVRMMKRPQNTEFQHLFSMKGKFNSILEERLLDGKADNHFIISTEVDLKEFNCSGGLSSAGMTSFWNEINKGMKKFDNDDIMLKPRQKANTAEQASKAERRLPSLPPKRGRSHSPSSHSQKRNRHDHHVPLHRSHNHRGRNEEGDHHNHHRCNSHHHEPQRHSTSRSRHHHR